MTKTLPFLLGFFSLGVLSASPASAGVFNTVQFTPPGQHAVGVEGEVQLSNGSGAGGAIRYNQGISDLSNFNALLGTGGGGRGFRVGGNMTFDFFPDVAGQPGIGLAVQGIYYRVTPEGGSSGAGQLELTLIPYLHKSFALGGRDEIDPYVAVPAGANFSGGRYTGTSTLVAGAMFRNAARFRYNIEFGIPLNQAVTYVSGGVLFSL